jgi:hypothetical protein
MYREVYRKESLIYITEITWEGKKEIPEEIKDANNYYYKPLYLAT